MLSGKSCIANAVNCERTVSSCDRSVPNTFLRPDQMCERVIAGSLQTCSLPTMDGRRERKLDTIVVKVRAAMSMSMRMPSAQVRTYLLSGTKYKCSTRSHRRSNSAPCCCNDDLCSMALQNAILRSQPVNQAAARLSVHPCAGVCFCRTCA